MVREPGTLSQRPAFEVYDDHRRGEGVAGADGVDDFGDWCCGFNNVDPTADYHAPSFSAGHDNFECLSE